jgi:hypothetical protein
MSKQITKNEFEKLQEISKSVDGISVGKLFRINVADGYAFYLVTKVNKTTCSVEWLNLGGDGYQDHFFGAGRTGVKFKDVEGHIAAYEFVENVFKSQDEFADSIEVGQIYHYHNSGTAYVRCEVVEDNGKRFFKPIALVGKWSSHDLPRRNLDGTVNLPYHARIVIEGDDGRDWIPNESCVYEHSSFTSARGPSSDFDPREADPIDLTLPKPTPAQEEQYRLIRELEGVRKLATLDNTLDCDWSDPRSIAKAVEARLVSIKQQVKCYV